MAAFELLPDAGHASSAVNAALDAARSALSLGRDQDAADMARRVERAWTAADPGTRAELAADRSEALLILGHALASGSPEESGAAYRLGWGSAPDDETRALFLVADSTGTTTDGSTARSDTSHPPNTRQRSTINHNRRAHPNSQQPGASRKPGAIHFVTPQLDWIPKYEKSGRPPSPAMFTPFHLRGDLAGMERFASTGRLA